MPEFVFQNVVLHYESFGTGEPLLFLHGLGSSTQDWEHQIPAFAKQYTVYVLDLRGHGQSSKPARDYSLRHHQKDITAFITEEIQQPVHLIGLSLGAMLACLLAADSPSLVRSLTLINCPGSLKLSSFKHRAHYVARILIIRLLGMAMLGRFLAPRLFPNSDQNELRKQFVFPWAKNDRKAYLQTMRAMIGWEIATKISQVRCPVWVIASEKDYFPLEEKQHYVSQCKQAQLLLVRHAHHALPVEAPEELNQKLLDVLGRNP